MLRFKEFLTEATKQQLWSDALNSKPEKYGAGFVDLVTADPPHKFDLLDGSDTVVLDKSNTKLLDILSGALGKEGLAAALYAADPDQKIIKWNITKSGKFQSPKWKVVKSNNNIDHVPLNSLGKDSVKPASTPSGGEWESMISIGYNMQRLGQTTGPTAPEAKKEEYGIPFKEYESMKKDFWGKWGDSAIEVGKAFYAKVGTEKMTQYGTGSGTLSTEWKDWHTGGRKNTTPKTDMYLGTGGVDQRISLKKVGGGQVMSAAAGESIATFNAALTWMGEKDNKEVGGMIDRISKEFKKISLGGSIEDLKAKKGFANPKNMSANTHSNFMDQIATQNVVHQNLGKDINDMFNNNPKLKYWFVYEAASGKKKFGDTTATADLVIEFDPTKKEKNAIKKYKNLNQKTDIDNLVKETEFFVAFKTGQKSPFSAMRTRRAKIEKKANEQFEFDNIDDMPTLRHLIIDHIESNELTRTFLPENFEQLDEFALLNRAIQGIKRGASRLKAGAKEMYLNLTVRVKKFVEGLIEKVGMVLDKIKKLAGKALHALLKFFGFEVDKVTSSGPALVFGKMG